MPVSAAFRAYILEQLNRLAPVTARGMFGGVGLYTAGLFFAVIDDDTLYFKADDGNRPAFEAAGLGPFRPFGPDTPAMQYYEVPADAIDDPDALRPWLEGALAAARAAREKKGGNVMKKAVAKKAVAKAAPPAGAAARKVAPAGAAKPAAAKVSASAKSAKPSATPAGISDAAVKKATGKTWPQWLRTLDAAGCRAMTHREIVAVVRDAHGQGPWWQQMITVGYEQARGLRVKHQVAGGFTATATRTVDAPVSALFEAWFDVKRRRRWLADANIDVTSVRPPKSLRAVWVDGVSRLDVQFAAKGAARGTVSVSHERLPNARAVAKMKAYWGAALLKLKAQLEQ